MADHALNFDELEKIGMVLLGAAFADGEGDGSEFDTISEILIQLIGGEELPDALASRLETFTPTGFDLEATCKGLHLATADDRRALLRLIAEVTDADEVHTFGEDEYIRRVAGFIGAKPEEFEELTMALTFISSVGPPPVPEDAK